MTMLEDHPTAALVSSAAAGKHDLAVAETITAAQVTADKATADKVNGRLNWLRAGVLGANDGIVSTAAIVLGVAGATAQRSSILLAGVVGLLAGAMSMAVGEYVSVSAQRDAERSALNLAEEDQTSPVAAGLASLVAFVVGALIPLAGVLISPNAWVTVAAVIVALAITGAASARLGHAPIGRAVARNIVGGSVAMAVTYGLGNLVGGVF